MQGSQPIIKAATTNLVNFLLPSAKRECNQNEENPLFFKI
jgi:hypothetical protein